MTGPDGSVITSDTAGGKVVIAGSQDATAPQTTICTSSPIVYAAPTVVASAPAIVAQETAADSSQTAILRVSQSAPVIATLPGPILPAQASPIVTPHIAMIAQNSLDAVIASPSRSVAATKTAASPALVAGPILYTQGIHGFYI